MNVKREPDYIMSEAIDPTAHSHNSSVEEDENSDDPVVKELDIYLSRSLANKIYILQYPIKPIDKSFDHSNYLNARMKPKQNRLELEIALDTRNENYSKVKGEQFALNVDGKQTTQSGKLNIKQMQVQQQQNEQLKYFNSNLMDKQVYVSTNASLGQMNKLYHLGVVSNNSVHLTPVQSILQMKPSFEYFDIYDKKVKDIKDSTQPNDTDYSTEEEHEEVDKAELVTLKYSLQANSTIANQQEAENWTHLKFHNLNEDKSHSSREKLLCKDKENFIKLNVTNEQLMTL